MNTELIDKTTLLITQALAFAFVVCATCGIVATALPQQWRLTQVLTKIGALTVRAVTKTPPVVALLVAGLVLSACAGTFEEAKLASRTAAPPVAASTPERCQTLSERQYWFTGAGVASGAIGAAAAGMTLPVESKTVDTVLIVTTVAGGVGAGAFGWFGANAGADYVREGCGK